MIRTCTLLTLFAFSCITAAAQDLTGIWRGSFVSADKHIMSLFNIEDRYKYELQLDQDAKAFTGVTYSYKSTVFYGKASAKGTINPATGKVMVQELKLLELKMASTDVACWMVCWLQYTKNGDEEFLEGKYSSYRQTDSGFCDRGTVFLKRVTTSDFYKEPFLVKKEKEKKKITPVTPPKDSAHTDIVKNNPKTSNPVKTKTHTRDTADDKTGNMKSVPLTAQLTPDKKMITPPTLKEPVFTPPVLRDRENPVVQTIVVNTTEVTLDIYDNGTIDHDTVSVFVDKRNVVNHQMLKETPITVKLKMDENNAYHEVVMVADNLGDIPPNTSLMVVKAGDKRYEVNIASTEQKNAVVVFKYEKPN